MEFWLILDYFQDQQLFIPYKIENKTLIQIFTISEAGHFLYQNNYFLTFFILGRNSLQNMEVPYWLAALERIK